MGGRCRPAESIAFCVLCAAFVLAVSSSDDQTLSWRGDVTQAAELAAGLLWVTKNKTLNIILMADLHHHGAHQAYSTLTRLGLPHVLFMTLGVNKCALSQDALPSLACCWSSLELPPGVAGTKRVLMLRAITAARIVALGYNLLLVDTDVVFMRDPYEHLKKPPFSAYTLTAMRGAVPRTASSAVLYVQGAARSGAVARMLEEVAERMMKWAEYGEDKAGGSKAGGRKKRRLLGALAGGEEALVSESSAAQAALNVIGVSAEAAAAAEEGEDLISAGPAGRRGLAATGTSLLHAFYSASPMGCLDASLLTDVILSAKAGRVVHWNCLKPTLGNAAALGLDSSAITAAGHNWDAAHSAALDVGSGGIRAMFEKEVVKSGLLEDLVAAKSYTVYWAQLQPELMLAIREAGGELAIKDHKAYKAAAEHPLSRAVTQLRKVLQADRAYRHSHPARLEAGNAAVNETGHQLSQEGHREGNETFAFAPDWLFGAWNDRGASGFWDPGLAGSPPRQVVAHLGRVPGSSGAGRDAVRMAYGYFDWVPVHRAGSAMGASTGPGNLPKLVALSRSLVDRLAGLPWGDWQGVLRSLAGVAAVTGRTPVWPDPPCSAPWLGPNPASEGRMPLRPNMRVLPYGSLGDLRCTPAEYMSQQCLHIFSTSWLASPLFREPRAKIRSLRGMLEVEAAHVRSLLQDGSGNQSAANTIDWATMVTDKGQGETSEKLRHWWEEEGSRGRSLRAAEGEGEAFKKLSDALVQVEVPDVVKRLGKVSAGYGSRMDGHVILYLDTLIEPSPLPPAAAAAVANLMSKCTLFAKQ